MCRVTSSEEYTGRFKLVSCHFVAILGGGPSVPLVATAVLGNSKGKAWQQIQASIQALATIFDWDTCGRPAFLSRLLLTPLQTDP